MKRHKATGDEPLEVVNSGAEDWIEDAASVRCPACHDVGWYLDYSGGDHIEPLTLELLPCIHPECKASGQVIEHLSVQEVGFNRSVERGGLVMAVGRG